MSIFRSVKDRFTLNRPEDPKELQEIDRWIKDSLDMELPYFPDRKLPFSGEKKAAFTAVLVLLGISEEMKLHLLLTQRTTTVEHHKGQIAFPGGHIEPQDPVPQEISASLRETEEEVGIPVKAIHPIGKLDPLFTYTTGFMITPVIARLKSPLSQIPFQVNPNEIEKAFWVPLESLDQIHVRKIETFKNEKFQIQLPVFYYQEHRIWGATAAIIDNFLQRIKSTH